MEAEKPLGLVWLDLETTGLDTKKAAILEVAAVLTDEKFEEIDYVQDVVRLGVHAPVRAIEADDLVFEMHRANGLWADALRAPYAEADVLDSLAHDVFPTWAEAWTLTLAGSGVCHFDRELLLNRRPDFFAAFSYPIYDVGVLRRFASLAGVPNAPKFEGDHDHRALTDCRAAIAQAKHYVEFMRRRESTREARARRKAAK